MLYLIGMGPGDIKNLTMEAIDYLKSSDKLISFGRIGETAEKLSLKVEKVSTIGEIKDQVKESIKEETIAILASGDPSFYGILDYLKREGVVIDKVIPGMSSVQYMMAKLQMSWHQANLVSFHGREEEKEEKIRKIAESPLSIILTDKKNTPDYISTLLYQRNARGKIYAGFNLSYEDEVIVKKDIGEKIVESESLSVVVVEI